MAARSDGSVIWNYDPVSGHTAPIRAAAVARDGDSTVTAAADGSVIVWRRSTTTSDATVSWTPTLLPGPICGGPCTTATFSADGAWLLTGGRGGVARVDWTSAQGARFATLDHGAPITVARFRAAPMRPVADGPPVMELLTAGDDGQAKLWRFAPISAPTSAPTSTPTPAAPTAGAATRPSEVALLATIRGHGTAITHMAITPDGRRLVTGDIAGHVRITDLDTATALGAVDPTGPVERHVLPRLVAAATWVRQTVAGGWAWVGRVL